MGHADVTLALLEVDPAWTLEPVLDARGLPLVEDQGRRLTMWAHLTVNGVRRMCVGTCEPGKGDPEKELLGDAIRNGAMRFGIGTRLWSKADGADPFSATGDSAGREAAPPQELDQDTLEADQLYRQLAGLKGTPGAQRMKDWLATQDGASLQLEPLRNPEWRAAVQAELRHALQVNAAVAEPVPGPGAAELAAQKRAELEQQTQAILDRQAEHVPPEDTEVMEPDTQPPAAAREHCGAPAPTELVGYLACNMDAGHGGDHRWEEPF
jgi:hypothetical protein